MFCFYFQQSESDLSNETCQIKVSNCYANSINFCCCFIFIPLYILPKRSGVGGGGIRKMLAFLMCLDNKVDVHLVSMIFVIYILCYKYLFTLIANCTTLIIFILYEFIKIFLITNRYTFLVTACAPPFPPPPIGGLQVRQLRHCLFVSNFPRKSHFYFIPNVEYQKGSMMVRELMRTTTLNNHIFLFQNGFHPTSVDSHTDTRQQKERIVDLERQVTTTELGAAVRSG